MTVACIAALKMVLTGVGVGRIGGLDISLKGVFMKEWGGEDVLIRIRVSILFMALFFE